MRAVGQLLLVLLAIVGIVCIGVAGYLWKKEPCLSRCGAGTVCRNRACVGETVAPPIKEEKVKKRRSHGPGGSTNGGGNSAQSELKLEPGDDRVTTQGDALGRPEHVDFSEGGSTRTLSQADFDETFSPAQNKITSCIGDAIGDYPLTSGHIEVSFRVEKSGAVSRFRLSAPALLHRRGLDACAKSAVLALHFPMSGGANVVSYPFEIR